MHGEVGEKIYAISRGLSLFGAKRLQDAADFSASVRGRLFLDEPRFEFATARSNRYEKAILAGSKQPQLLRSLRPCFAFPSFDGSVFFSSQSGQPPYEEAGPLPRSCAEREA